MKEVTINEGKGRIRRAREKEKRTQKKNATTRSQERREGVANYGRKTMDQITSGDKPPQCCKNGKSQRRILGPVQNLEEHVRPDW